MLLEISTVEKYFGHNIGKYVQRSSLWPRIIKTWATGVGPQLQMEAGESPLIRKGATGIDNSDDIVSQKI